MFLDGDNAIIILNIMFLMNHKKSNKILTSQIWADWNYDDSRNKSYKNSDQGSNLLSNLSLIS